MKHAKGSLPVIFQGKAMRPSVNDEITGERCPKTGKIRRKAWNDGQKSFRECKKSLLKQD